MIGENLPTWAALIVAFCLVAGSLLTLLGSCGLLRLESFYERVHAPTLGATLGTGFVLIASIIYFSALGNRIAVHEILIAVFLTVTTPVGLMLLVRATLYRDRLEEQQTRNNVLSAVETGGAPDEDKTIEEGKETTQKVDLETYYP